MVYYLLVTTFGVQVSHFCAYSFSGRGRIARWGRGSKYLPGMRKAHRAQSSVELPLDAKSWLIHVNV